MFHRKKLVAATFFLPALDYSDMIYMNDSARSLHLLDFVHHGACCIYTHIYIYTYICIYIKKMKNNNNVVF